MRYPLGRVAWGVMATRGGVPVLLLSFLVTGAVAAQREPRSFLRLEIGRAEIHRASRTGAAVGLRVGRRVDARGITRLELGASYSGADEGYAVLEVGAEVRPLATGRVTPVVGVGAGFLVEPTFRGEVLRGTAALEVEVSERIALRLGGQLGHHGGERGPHTVFFGIEWRGRAL